MNKKHACLLLSRSLQEEQAPQHINTTLLLWLRKLQDMRNHKHEMPEEDLIFKSIHQQQHQLLFILHIIILYKMMTNHHPSSFYNGTAFAFIFLATYLLYDRYYIRYMYLLVLALFSAPSLFRSHHLGSCSMKIVQIPSSATK